MYLTLRFVPVRNAVACFLALALTASLFADDWPQWRGPSRDGVWKETGVLEAFDTDQLKPEWRAPVGAGYAGPTVSGDRVYVMSHLTKPKPVEQVHCVDRATGEVIWTHVYDCEYFDVGYPLGPRAAVALSDGKAYALGTMGHLHCLDAETGEVLWEKELESEYEARIPVWGITASPLVDESNVYLQVGGLPDAAVMAFDKETGEERWRALDGAASYSAPKFIEQNGKTLLLVWTGDWFAALHPESGDVAWKHAFKRAKGVINVADPVVDTATGRIFLSSFYDGSYLYQLKSDAFESELLWSRRGRSEIHTDALHSIIMTSVIIGDYVYGIDSYGAMRCLDLKNGERVWEDQTLLVDDRWATAFFVQNGDRTWITTERGELVIGRLTPDGFERISSAQLIEPTTFLPRRSGNIVWSQPAFAHRSVFARNDKELIRVDLSR